MAKHTKESAVLCNVALQAAHLLSYLLFLISYLFYTSLTIFL